MTDAPHASSTDRRQRLTQAVNTGVVGLPLLLTGTVFARILDPPYDNAGTGLALSLDAGIIALTAGGFLLRARLQRSLAAHSAAGDLPMQAPLSVGAADPSAPGGPLSPTEELDPAQAMHPTIVRLAEILPKTMLISRDGLLFSMPDNQCEGFVLRHRTKGGFSQPKVSDDLFELIVASIGGKWSMNTRAEVDEAAFTRKVRFPKLVSTPVLPRVADSIATAVELHKDAQIALGVRGNGQPLTLRLSDFPHWLVVGITGTGKSVFNRGVIIEQFRALGFMIFLCDGKTTDYDGMLGVANIVAVSQATPDHMRVVRMFAEELRSRQTDTKTALRNRTSGDRSSAFRRPPALLLIDEWATVRADVLELYGTRGVDELIKDLLFITRVGREFKMHLVLSTQEAYRATLEGPLVTNLTAKISLGAPEERTIQDVIKQPLRVKARQIGSTITRDDKGRALAALANEDTGENEVVEFQSYWGYSPGEPKPDEIPPVLAHEHHQFRQAVSDQIPKLYPRLWFQVPDPHYGADLAVLYDLPLIALDRQDGTPNPDTAIFDPVHPSYQGTNTDAAPPIPSLDELTDGHAYTRTHQSHTTTPVNGAIRSMAAESLEYDTDDLPPSSITAADVSSAVISPTPSDIDGHHWIDDDPDDSPFDEEAISKDPRARVIPMQKPRNRPRGGGIVPF